MDRRMLVVDLDGTLLDTRERVSPRNRRALARARAAGHEVVVATGRTWNECRHALEQVPESEWAITAGGSCLCRADDGQVVEAMWMDGPVVASCVEAVVAAGHVAHVLRSEPGHGAEYLLVGDGELDPASAWWFETLGVRRTRLPDFGGWREQGLAERVLRVGTVAHHGELVPLASSLRGRVAGAATLQHWPAVTATEATGSETHMLEIFALGVDKWSMVERLCARAGIGAAAVVAIGDGLNDLTMLERAGVGIAMANADPRAVAVADRRAGHHDRDGVAEAVECLLEEWGCP